MREPRITSDEVLAELARLSTRPKDPGLSVAEMVHRTGKSRLKVRMMLKLAQLEGRLVIGWADRPRIDGRPTPVPVYRVLPAKRK